jgi:hypothetical protein
MVNFFLTFTQTNYAFNYLIVRKERRLCCSWFSKIRNHSCHWNLSWTVRKQTAWLQSKKLHNAFTAMSTSTDTCRHHFSFNYSQGKFKAVKLVESSSKIMMTLPLKRWVVCKLNTIASDGKTHAKLTYQPIQCVMKVIPAGQNRQHVHIFLHEERDRDRNNPKVFHCFCLWHYTRKQMTNKKLSLMQSANMKKQHEHCYSISLSFQWSVGCRAGSSWIHFMSNKKS